MAHFQNISVNDMRAFLRSDKGWQESIQGREILFSFPLKSVPRVQVKVYTGIKSDTGQSRGVGCDAIRVCAVDVVSHAGWIKARRVHRVMGWQNNLRARVLKVIEQSKARMRTK